MLRKESIELADGDIAGHLDVLLLVGTYRDKVAVVYQDVSGLEEGVREQAVIWAEALSNLILIACARLQKAHRGHAGEYPSKFGNLGHIGLPPEDGFFGIKAEGEIVHGDIQAMLGDISR